jgi:hypothetical protein
VISAFYGFSGIRMEHLRGGAGMLNTVEKAEAASTV